jgi:hypothetical protein
LTLLLVLYAKTIVMKMINYKNFLLLFLSVCLTGCEAIGDIFKAGMWFAIVLIALVVGLVIFIIGKLRG